MLVQHDTSFSVAAVPCTRSTIAVVVEVNLRRVQEAIAAAAVSSCDNVTSVLLLEKDPSDDPEAAAAAADDDDESLRKCLDTVEP